MCLTLPSWKKKREKLYTLTMVVAYILIFSLVIPHRFISFKKGTHVTLRK